MSLFGSSPDDDDLQNSRTASKDQRSLFDDEQAPGSRSHGSLFDDNGASGNSPWNMPAGRKAGRSDLVKSLLPATAVPDGYIDAYDVLLDSEYKTPSGRINSTGVRKLLAEGTGLGKTEQDNIFSIVSGGQDSEVEFGRNEINVLIALLGLSQEHEEATLDSVDERRTNLPQPSLPLVSHLRSSKSTDNMEKTPPKAPRPSTTTKSDNSQTSPSKSRRLRKDSLDSVDADPWASPALHKGHTHAVNNEATPSGIETTAARPLTNGVSGSARTTSSFTTRADGDASTPANETNPSYQDSSGGGWGTYEHHNRGFGNAGETGLSSAGFGSAGEDQTHLSGGSFGRSLGGGRATNRTVEETVTVTLLPEKEGMFLFQHRNYELKSARRASSVIRRYSDFVWLLDCLHKRYPFRQLPLLPPKTIAVNGRHLSADVTFIEKRRRGLVRFVNALVRHPVLGQEQLVIMFLTVPTELAALRKQATKSVEEEFTGKSLPPGLEDALPTNLPETFETVRSGVRSSAEAYIGLCSLLERMSKRSQGIAADQLRFSHALTALTDASESTYAVDTNDIPLLNEGIKATAKHLSTAQSLLDDESRAWDEGVLEDLKKQRDALVSVRDMFDRRDRYARNNIPQLERRIENNENKLASLMRRPEGVPIKPGEQEKLEQAVRADKQSIVEQHARGVFIKECIRDELIYFQQSQYHVSRLHQDWSQERVKYAELQADNWRALNEELENMPTGE